MTPKEFLKSEDYFDSVYFPFNTVEGLLFRYAAIVSAEKDKEIERLKGLLENLVKRHDRWDSEERGFSFDVIDKQAEIAWQDYKTENNI